MTRIARNEYEFVRLLPFPLLQILITNKRMEQENKTYFLREENRKDYTSFQDLSFYWINLKKNISVNCIDTPAFIFHIHYKKIICDDHPK